MIKSINHRRGLALGAAAMVALGGVGLTACSPPGGDVDTDTSAGEVSQDLGDEDIKLVLYDGAGLKDVDQALADAFTAQYPNVTIELRLDPDNVQAVNAPRVLAGENPPDIARIVALGDIVADGLLTDLTSFSELYDWSSIPEGQLAQYTATEDGVRGSGTQWTVASGFTVTGVYYNKEHAQAVGMTETPTSLEEFEGYLAQAQAQGLVPISTGNQTGQAATSFQFLLNNSMGQAGVNDWIFRVPGATIDTPEGIAAADTTAEWGAEGYFGPDANGMDNNASLAQFVAGDALFYNSGNWDAKSLADQMGDNVAFMPPWPNAEGKVLAMSDPLSNFGIPAKSQNKDAAAAFLNFLMSDEARAIVVDFGFAPSGAGEVPPVEAGSLNEQVQQAFADLVDSDGQVQFIQNASNGATAAWNAQIQLLISGQTTGADMMAAVQQAYEEELD